MKKLCLKKWVTKQKLGTKILGTKKLCKQTLGTNQNFGKKKIWVRENKKKIGTNIFGYKNNGYEIKCGYEKNLAAKKFG